MREVLGASYLVALEACEEGRFFVGTFFFNLAKRGGGVVLGGGHKESKFCVPTSFVCSGALKKAISDVSLFSSSSSSRQDKRVEKKSDNIHFERKQ